MFYEQKLMNGSMHYRVAPDGEWMVKPPEGTSGAAKPDLTATVETLGLEWVRPDAFWSGSGEDGVIQPYSGAVAIQTNVGTLLLARVMRFTSSGLTDIRRVPVKPSELNVMNR